MAFRGSASDIDAPPVGVITLYAHYYAVFPPDFML